jgi:hypothetical protein
MERQDITRRADGKIIIEFPGESDNRPTSTNCLSASLDQQVQDGRVRLAQWARSGNFLWVPCADVLPRNDDSSGWGTFAQMLASP